MTALKEPAAAADLPTSEPEVLIEEAHRRHRRRRAAIGGIAGILAVAAVIFGISSGGGPPSGPASTARGDGSGHGLTATWQELSAPGGALPVGTQVSDVISYHGELVATGSSGWPARLSGHLGCRSACEMVVWVSHDGRRWRAVFAAQQSDGGNALVPTKRGLALLSPGIQSLDGGSSLRHSKTAIRDTFLHQTPAWMTGPANTSEGQMVFSIGEDDAGLPTLITPNINIEPAWVSADGVHWPPSFETETFRWRSAVKVRGGFVGITQTASRSTVLWSRNGRSWSRASVSIPVADVAALASGPSGAVLELIPSRYPYRPGPVQLWYSSNGRSWSRATVIGPPPVITDTSGTMPALIAADGGFLAFNRTNTGIWWSKTGQVWTRVTVTGAPPAKLEPQGVSVDGNSLLLIEQRRPFAGPSPSHPSVQFGPATFWRMHLTVPAKLKRPAA